MEIMRKELEGKTAVVTGASRGIGERIVKLFAENGANVIACARKADISFECRLKELADHNRVATYPIYFDLGDRASIKDGIKAIKLLKESVDILVNNAGVGHLALVPMISMKDMDEVFQINYFAQVQLIQGLYRALTKARGCIINIASVSGIDGDMGNAIYGASKACMILLTKVLAKELSTSSVRVNAVAPGLTDTDFAKQMGISAKESMIDSSLMHRLAETEEVAQSVLFLASDRSSFINGQIIRIDGGIK